MTSYVKGMIKDFPAKLEGEGRSVPWAGKMFSVDAKLKRLDDERAKIFHTNRHDKLCQGYDQGFPR